MVKYTANLIITSKFNFISSLMSTNNHHSFDCRSVITKCSRCNEPILPPDLVIRSPDQVYHVPCFTCVVCNVILSQGDYFKSDGRFIFCKNHFNQCPSRLPQSFSPLPHLHHHHHNQYQNLPSIPGVGAGGIIDPLPLGNNNVSNSTSKTTGRKGRPRKRKVAPVQSNENNCSELGADGQTRTVSDSGNCNTNQSGIGNTRSNSPTMTSNATLHHGLDSNFESTNIPGKLLLHCSFPRGTRSSFRL